MKNLSKKFLGMLLVLLTVFLALVVALKMRCFILTNIN